MTGQETKTLLQAGTVVEKDCQRIALRGLLDTACAYCVCALSAAQGKNIRAAEDAKEMLSVLYDLTRCEALGEPYEFRGVFGFGADEVRAASHNPQKYIAAEHCFTLDETTPMEVALLNLLRTQIRSAERAAVCAAKQEGAWMQTLCTALNRLSSACYLAVLRAKKWREEQEC